MLKIDFLSEEDREYLRSAECAERSKSHLDEEQAWELVDGTKLVGTVVDYTRTKVTIQRCRGRIYINDRHFDSLPPIYQTVVIKMVGHFEQIADVDRDRFTQWVMQQRGQPRVFQVDGILLELEDGNEYKIPFELFSSRSLQMLQGGWDAWLAAYESEDYEALDDEAFRLRAQAAAMVRNQELSQQIAMAQLDLDLIRSGITSLWEVTLFPAPAIPIHRDGSWSRDAITSKQSTWQCSRIPVSLPGPCGGFGRRIAAGHLSMSAVASLAMTSSGVDTSPKQSAKIRKAAFNGQGNFGQWNNHFIPLPQFLCLPFGQH